MTIQAAERRQAVPQRNMSPIHQAGLVKRWARILFWTLWVLSPFPVELAQPCLHVIAGHATRARSLLKGWYAGQDQSRSLQALGGFEPFTH